MTLHLPSVPPLINRGAIDTNPKVVVNNTVVVNCPVSGIPVPQIQWLRNDVLLDVIRYSNIAITANGRQLRIKNARVSDAASYRCVALNDAGEDSVNFDLEVHGKWTVIYFCCGAVGLTARLRSTKVRIVSLII